MESKTRIQALSVMTAIALSSLAFVPGAQANVEPVLCAHDLINNATCASALAPPGTPVGGGLMCNYAGGEVGGEVHAGAMSIQNCYSVDPGTACGGRPGFTVYENGIPYTQCIDPAACPGVGAKILSSINELNSIICVDPLAPCGVEVTIITQTLVAFSTCMPIIYAYTTPCAGFVGTELVVGHPMTGDLVTFCF